MWLLNWRMHKFIVKNTGDFSLYLEDTNGNVMRLRPNEAFSYDSEDEELHPVLEKQYSKGNIDFWRLRQPIREHHAAGVWKHEGF